VALYDVEPDKVSVIYEAAAPGFRPVPRKQVRATVKRYGLADRYLVHVGTIEPRKNLTRLVEALQLLHEQGLTIPLVVVGGKGWLYEGFFQRLEELEIRDRVHLPGYVADADLPALYQGATAAVVPSVYEGFGLPVLEAMACGTPVLASDVSSLPELGGDAARYFDPYSTEDIAAAIRTVWSGDELRVEMSQAGLAQAAKFSWAQAAAETRSLYRRLLP
jgi:glycosyltransferase involved in cell wall biosynthesis